MSGPGVQSITISKGDTVFHVHGDQAGAEGVWLAKGQVSGIYDAPVKTTWKTGAFQEGSRQKARKYLQRDLNLGFHVVDTNNEYELNESIFRQMFDYQVDAWDLDPQPTKITVTTTLSGTRHLEVLMYEQPEFTADLDPIQAEYGNLIMKLRAGQPFWAEEDYIDIWSMENGGAGVGSVTCFNPTDQVSRQKWIVTLGTWTLPDFSWIGARGFREPGGSFGRRTITLPTITQNNGGAVVNLDRQELMLRDAHDTNILPLLGGRFFSFPIPPYTPPTELPVRVTGAPAEGAMVQLVMPRLWTRPWGLEYRD